MAYKSLMKLFYMDASSDRFANNERLAAERLGADSTFRTGMHTATGELFIALHRPPAAGTRKSPGASRRRSFPA